MNYSGKFDAKFSADGSGPHSTGYVHVETAHATHVPPGAIVVPDAQLLFNGEFKRFGVDLVLSKDDREIVFHDYFKGEKRAALSSPDGAHLSGDLVNALAGHVDYAQADGSPSVSHVIGHVTKLVGTATAIRNGVSITLNNGDNVEKGDVVLSGSNSTLGITFIDGTVFGLSSNARMVLNEMVYDPNGSNNSSLLSLVAGTITFVAGETAKHGDMKIDTPVATMGIRGTAVLVEIDFTVPSQNGAPDAKFQVLVEPDGTTGSYILFDKLTLTPLAVVDKAGQQINISNGILSQTTAPLSPEVQKLITDVFALKFSDNSNTKLFDHHTDSLTPQALSPIKLASGATATPIVLLINTQLTTSSTNTNGPANPNRHIDGPPTAVILDSNGGVATAFQISELVGKTGDTADFDHVSGRINFVDLNAGDNPTVSSKFDSYTYKDAHGNIASLNAQQIADIKAVEVDLALKPDPGNNNNGTVVWTYNDPTTNPLSVPDSAFDFLAAGETLQLTYALKVDNNFAPNDEATTLKFTITVTGTNDVPVITTAAETVNFVNVGTSTTGPNLNPTPNVPTSNTLTFTDPDLTDTHKIVSTDLTSATLAGNGAPVLDKLALETKFPRPMGVFESALSAAVTTDSTGTGTGTITWTLADISAYYADIVPAGETLTLTFTVKVKDSQGAIATQNVIVTIVGKDAPAVVWVETTDTASTDAAPGDWNGAHNWETGTVPTANDDAIVITNQLQGKTPFYPVTIKAGAAAAFANSVTMNDFANIAPELDIGRVLTPDEIAHGVKNGSLTIGAALSLNANSILKNFGTLSVGSIAEILNQSVLTNSGLITLTHGGDFKDSSTITNTGTIKVVADTLNVQVNIANSGVSKGLIQIDDSAELALSSGATIDGGALTLGSGSKLDIESSKGATLDGVTVTGTGGVTPSMIDIGATTTSGSILMLDDGTSITNGNLTIAGGSTLDIESSKGATLDGVTVIGTNAATGVAASTVKVDIAAASSSILTLDDGTTINNGNITIGSGSTLDVEAGKNGPGATLDGVLVSETVASGSVVGMIDVGTTSTATLLLNDGTTITGGAAGTLTIGGGSTLDIEAGKNGPGATLDGVLVSETVASGSVVGMIDVGTTSTATLLLNDGTAITGGAAGTLTVGSGSTLDVEAGKNGPGATLDGVLVTETVASGSVVGMIDVGTTSTATLLLNDGTTITGGAAGTLTIGGGSTLDIEAGKNGPGATLDGVLVTGTNAANGVAASTIKVDVSAAVASILTLDDGSKIKNGNLTIGSGSTLDIEKGRAPLAAGTPDATLDGVTVTGTNASGESGTPASTIAVGAHTTSGSILTLDDGTTINNGNMTIASGSKLDIEKGAATLLPGAPDAILDGVTVMNSGTIQVDGAVGGPTVTLVLDGGTTVTGGKLLINASAIINGTVEVGTGGATLDDVTVTNNHTLKIDNGATLTLAGATIDGGTINDGTIVGAPAAWTGQINVTADSKIDSSASLNNGYVTIASGKVLTLDNVTVTGTTFTDTAGGTIKVDDTTTLTLAGATIDGGAINDGTLVGGLAASTGQIDVTGASTIDSNAILNNGYVTVESGVTLALDNVTVNGTIFNDVATGGTIQIDGGDTLGFNGATINGGTLNVFGELDSTGISLISGATIVNQNHIKVVSGTLTIDPTPVTNTGTIEVKSGSTLVLSGETITNSSGTKNGIIQVDAADPTHFATLDLQGSTINGGTLTVSGVLDSTGASFLTGATIDYSGTIDVTAGTLTIDATSTLNNAGGKLETDGGNLIIKTGLSGSLEINHGAVLELGAGPATTYSAVTVTFDHDATGTLKLDNSQVFGGKVVGLDDNTIDLVDISSVDSQGKFVPPTVTYSGNATGGTLTIVSNVDPAHPQVAHIQLTGDYTGVTWAATPDGNGGTSITEVPGAIATGLTNGNAVEGTAVSVSVTDGGQSVTPVSYQWQLGGTDIQGANQASYTPAEGDEGNALSVTVKYIDALTNKETTNSVSAGTVTGTADVPKVSTPDAVTTAEDIPVKLTNLVVSTNDHGADDGDTFSATVYVDSGALALGSNLKATITGGAGHGVADAVVITGTLDDVNKALAAVHYTPTGEFEGTDHVHFSATSTDGISTAAATAPTVDITVTGTADKPTLRVGTSVGSTTESTATVLSGLSVNPGDGSANDGADSFTAKLYVENGKLSLDSGNFIVARSGDGSDSNHALTITGTLDDVNKALGAVRYTPTGEFEGIDNVHLSAFSTEDGTVGGNISATVTARTAIISVNPVAEAPVFSPTGYEGNENGTIPLSALATLTDSGDSLALDLSGFPPGATFTAGAPDTTNTGHWVVTAAQIAALGSTPLTMTPPVDYNGTFSLHAVATVTDTATGPDGTLTDTRTFSNDFAVKVDEVKDATVALGGLVNGNAVAGTPLTATLTDADAPTSGIAYLWTVGGKPQLTNTGNIYTPKAADQGKTIGVTVSFTDTHNNAELITTSAGTVQAPPTAPVVTTSSTVTFDDALAGTDGAALSHYLAGYGITLSSGGAGADPIIEDDRAIYGGGIVNATSGHNLIGESGGFPVSYTVTFAHALTSFAFDRVQENRGPSGSSYPQWTATAYDAAGNALATVGEGETFVFGSSVPAARYVLSGAGIDHVTFTGNDRGFDGFANALTDNWVLNGGQTATSSAPDNLQHDVFPSLKISDVGTTIDHARVSWSNLAGGHVSFAGLVFGGVGQNVTEGITVTLNGNGYDLTGVAPLSAYQDVLSHLALSSWNTQAVTFTVVVNDGATDSAPSTSTVNVAVPSTWDVWTGAGGTVTWLDNGANWSLNHAPTPSDHVFIDAVESTINLDVSGQSYSVAELNLTAGTELDVVGNGSATSSFEVTGPLINLGSISASRANLKITHDTFNEGGIQADNADGLVTIGKVTVDNSTDGVISADNGGTAVLDTSTIIGGEIDSSGAGSVVQFKGATIEHAHLVGDSGGVFQVTSGVATFDGSSGGFTIDAGSQINIDSSGTLALNGATITGTDITDNHLIDVTGSTTIQGTTDSNGVFTANANLSGGGLVTIESGQTLTLDHVTVSGTTIALTGIGDTLVADQATRLGTIAGFGARDTIDLTGVAFAPNEHAVWTQITTTNGGGGTLQIFEGSSTPVATLNLSGIYTQGEFTLAQDNTASHGTDVKFRYIPFSTGTINTNGAFTPLIGNAGSSLELTNGANGEAVSWFANAVYSIGNFTASFDYQATGNALADGMAFILQNSTAGINALGRDGSSLGYGALANTNGGDAISPSAAIEFNLYGPNTPGTAFATNGGIGPYTPTANVNFATGDAIQAVISYNGTVLAENLTDLVNGATYSTSYTVDLASVVGSGTAYVGFSAATGGLNSTQTISNFTFSPPTVTITVVTPDGLDFQHHNALVQMGSGTIQPGGSSTSFTILDSADGREFVLDGNNFTYAVDGTTVTGGTIRSFHEFKADGTTALADFTGVSVDAVTWLSAVKKAASGDHSFIDALTSKFAYNFVGGSGPDTFGSAGHADTLSGTGADFFDGGGAPVGSHDTLSGGAHSTFVFGKGYGALTITNFDQASNAFNQADGDHIQLKNGLTAPQNVRFPNGSALLDFGSGDIVTLLNVSQTQYESLAGSEFSTGGGNGGPTGSREWSHNIDFFGVTQAGTSTQWIVPNYDGLTSTVLSGGGITYDPTSHLPTNGGVNSINLVYGSIPLETISGVTVSAGDFGAFITRIESIQGKIAWSSLIETNNNGPLSFSPTDIRIANSDGTFTDIIGTGFAQAGSSTLSGTVTSVELLDSTQTHVLQTVNFGLSTSLSDLAAALFPDEASKQFYDLMAQGNTAITGNATQLNAPTNFNFTLDDAPGNHTFTGVAGTPYSVNFGDATSGVTANLALGRASWGGFTDTLVNISNINGSKFADTIIGSNNASFLDGGGAPSGSNDTLTEGAGSKGNTFVFGKGYGALTITNFDQASGTFDKTEGDHIQLNNLSSTPTVTYVPDGNTTDAVLTFGNGDVVTLLHVSQSQYESLGTSEFFTGGNNGGGGNNNSGPVINNANNTVTYVGTPVFLDQSISVTDTTGTVTSVNAWISAGAQTGDKLEVNNDPRTDGDLTNPDGSIIHYHFDGNAISLAEKIGTSISPTLADFNAALQQIQFSPGAADGTRTVTWAAHEANIAITSPTVTTTINDSPILNSFKLTVTQGVDTVLTTADFNVTNSKPTDFFSLLPGSVKGGEFEVYNGTTWVPAPTGGPPFSVAEVGASHVRFHQQGGAIVPDFSIWVTDGSNPSPAIAPNVSLEIAGANSDNVSFGGANGTLLLDTPSSFSGVIAGVSGTGDVLDLKGFAAAADPVVATPAGNYHSDTNTTSLVVTDNTTLASVTLRLAGDYSGSSWSATVDTNGDVMLVDQTAPQTIANGGTLHLTNPGAPGEGVAFQGSTGTLIIDQPSKFVGVISGFTGQGTAATSDQIDLKGIDQTLTSFFEIYNSTTNTLSVTDGTNAATLHFNGIYQQANFHVQGDGSGGTIIFDPPVSSGSKVDGVVMHDPGPAASTIVASGPNQTLSGAAVSDTFVFNFAGVGQARVADFHPDFDLLQFKSPIFASAQAAMDATHDDCHGNTVVAIDAQDTITLGGVLKAQLHVSDFHIV